jgi:hypothetical protein
MVTDPRPDGLDTQDPVRDPDRLATRVGRRKFDREIGMKIMTMW